MLTHRFGAAYATLVLIFGLAGHCGCRSAEKPASAAVRRPWAFLLREGNYPGEKGPRIDPGLIFAVWDDGTFVRASAADAVGSSYVRGVMNPQDRSRLLERLEATAAKLPAGDSIPVDGGGYVLRFRSEKGVISRVEPINAAKPAAESGMSELEAFVFSMKLTQVESSAIIRSVPSEWYE